MNKALRPALAAAAVAGLVHAAPLTTWAPGVRRRHLPGLAGVGDADHVALTFDDGPDIRSTPQFLSVLDELDTKATFFMLGSMVDREPALAAEIAAAGHEIAVHGYLHQNLLRRTPWGTYHDLARARDTIADVTGVVPTLFRPPYGVLSAAALASARRLGMRPVLWTAWGRDWEANRTGDWVFEVVCRDLGGGGTILLHDSDCTSTPNSWKATLAAVPTIVETCRQNGWDVGPLSEHALVA